MKRALAAVAAVMMVVGCGAEMDEVTQSESALEPASIEITRSVGYVPDMGGATYEIEIGAKSSRDVWCRSAALCDGVELFVDEHMHIPTTGTTVSYYLYDGVPSCSARAVKIICQDGSSVESVWSAN